MEETRDYSKLGPATTDQEYEVIQAVNLFRGLILDFLETKFKEREDWKQIRANILKLLGDNGLERRLRMIVKERNGTNGNR